MDFILALGKGGINAVRPILLSWQPRGLNMIGPPTVTTNQILGKGRKFELFLHATDRAIAA
jgi:hypothetical protein